MEIISTYNALITFIVFAGMMLSLALLSKDKAKTKDGFLLANRNLGWKRGAFSIAVSWIWAPAIFVCSLQTYLNGLAGAFWFIVPNVLCFFVFAPLAIRLRKLLPNGYTFTGFIKEKYPNNKLVHLSFLIIFCLAQLFAILSNATAGGLLLNLLTGIEFSYCVIGMSLVALTYSLANGFKASVLTDLVQMSVILIIAFILVPWVLFEVDGLNTVRSGLGGVSGKYTSMFNIEVALAFGLSAFCTLIFGPAMDQMFFQRALAVKAKDITKTFVAGGLIFGLVPLSLCLLGFVAAAPEISANLDVTDPQMVSPIVIAEFLPNWAILLFTFMAMAGLCSTLDSAYCAISALGSTDIYHQYINRSASSEELLKVSRYFMLALAIIGTLISLLRLEIIWIFIIYGVLGACCFFPVVFALYSSKISAKGLSIAILVPLILALPTSIYAKLYDLAFFNSYTSALAGTLSLLICLLYHMRK